MQEIEVKVEFDIDVHTGVDNSSIDIIVYWLHVQLEWKWQIVGHCVKRPDSCIAAWFCIVLMFGNVPNFGIGMKFKFE